MCRFQMNVIKRSTPCHYDNQYQTCYHVLIASSITNSIHKQQMKLITSYIHTIYNFTIDTHNNWITYLPPSGGEPSTIGVLERDEALGALEVPGTYSYKGKRIHNYVYTTLHFQYIPQTLAMCSPSQLHLFQRSTSSPVQRQLEK